jgi:hypothetical protein
VVGLFSFKGGGWGTLKARCRKAPCRRGWGEAKPSRSEAKAGRSEAGLILSLVLGVVGGGFGGRFF